MVQFPTSPPTGGMYTCQWWVDAATEGLTPPDAVAWGEDESRAAFTSGNAAMILDGFTTAGDFNEIPDFDYPTQWASHAASRQGWPGLAPRVWHPGSRQDLGNHRRNRPSRKRPVW